MSAKLVVPIALGLSLVTVTAFVAYYIFKKDEEDGEGDKLIKTSRVNVIEVNVPKSIVPALIGRSGSNIKEIEKKANVMIHFKKFSDKDYDVCIIRGRSESTQLAETLIHDFIRQQPVIVEDTMVVPGWACGRIIGQGGENINEISHCSGARVKIEGNHVRDNSTQRVITFKGTKEQIDQAKKLIEACVAQEKCRREIEQSKRSPRHAQATVSPVSPVPPSDADTGDAKPKYKRPEGAGASIEVYVSAVSSPSRFWVQLVGPQVAQLDDLVEHMTEYYNNRDNRANHALKQVSIGQVVAAVFRHDGRWYRARVHDIRPNEFDATQQVADVFYVDYGDSEYVATHELCELRADLLRLRFQAMECFLAGVKPAGREEEVVGLTAAGQRWDRWDPHAVERFEQLTQVARWKSLVSRTCTYKKTVSADGEKEKEIPGIKLFEVTEEGELDIGATLIAEGWAVAAAPSPRASPPRPAPALPAPPTPSTPFGDLGNSRVLGMLNPGGARSSSVPKDHKDDGTENLRPNDNTENDKLSTSKSHASGLDSSDKPNSVTNFDLTYPNTSAEKPHLNGSHDFLSTERQQFNRNDSVETLVPDLKAKMNRIDSHHGNLEHMGKSQNDLHNVPVKNIPIFRSQNVETPKRPMSAYMLWLNANRERIKSENAGKKVTEIAKIGGAIWRNMLPAEKVVWFEKSETSLEQYLKDMDEYKAKCLEKGQVDSGGDGDKPKQSQRILTFTFWLNENREKLQSENPGKDTAEIADIGSEIWRNMDPVEKIEWFEKVDKCNKAALEKYYEDLNEYEAKYPNDDESSFSDDSDD